MTGEVAERNSFWICRRNLDFILRHWPDGSVLFDEANGQLQRLNPWAGRIMALFLDRPEWAAPAMTTALFGETFQSEDLEIVEQALENIRSLDLIERLPD